MKVQRRHMESDVMMSGPDPLDELLASYACGSLNAPLQVLVASHLAISSRNRSFVNSFETLCAKEFTASSPRPLQNREMRLEAIFSFDDAPENVEVLYRDHTLPPPLASYLRTGFKEISWRMLLPGVREHKIERVDQGEASLLWIKAGRTLPAHTHEGSEISLVLKGGFTDSSGHYKRGDIAIADAELDHHPVADEHEDCICFAVTDAPLRLTGPVGRIFQRMFGH